MASESGANCRSVWVAKQCFQGGCFRAEQHCEVVIAARPEIVMAVHASPAGYNVICAVSGLGCLQAAKGCVRVFTCVCMWCV